MNKSEAYHIVAEAFYDKKDKAGEPYIHHILRVVDNLRYFLDETENKDDYEITALLHDLIEDCKEWTIKDLIELDINPEVIEAVELLTISKGQKYDEYIENILSNKIATTVKLADLKDNMDLTRLKVLKPSDLERTIKYHRSYRYLIDNFDRNSK